MENRVSAAVIYSFGERVTAVAGTSDTSRTGALSDPELTLLVRFWAASFAPGVGRRAWVSLVVGAGLTVVLRRAAAGRARAAPSGAHAPCRRRRERLRMSS